MAGHKCVRAKMLLVCIIRSIKRMLKHSTPNGFRSRWIGRTVSGNRRINSTCFAATHA